MVNIVDFLGFNNRTCTTSLTSKTTAGPVIRQGSMSEMWYEWLIRVEGEDNEAGFKVVSLQGFIDPTVEDDARCLGYMSTFYTSPGYNWTCSFPPYGNGLFLNGTKSSEDPATSSQSWRVQPARVDGEFELIAYNKPDVCTTALAVEDCNSLPVLVKLPVTTTGSIQTYTSWKFVKKYNLVANIPPPPPPFPPVPQPIPSPPVVPAIGPVISAPTSTSIKSVNVIVTSVGGNDQCSVEKITITSIGSNVGAVPVTVQVSSASPGLSSVGVPVTLKVKGYNIIYAVGTCSTGETTEMSNQLSVFYLPQSAGSPSPSPSPKAYFNKPYGVAVTEGLVFVTNTGDSTVMVCDLDDNTVLTNCNTATVEGNINNPYGITIAVVSSVEYAFIANQGSSKQYILQCKLVARDLKECTEESVNSKPWNTDFAGVQGIIREDDIQQWPNQANIPMIGVRDITSDFSYGYITAYNDGQVRQAPVVNNWLVANKFSVVVSDLPKVNTITLDPGRNGVYMSYTKGSDGAIRVCRMDSGGITKDCGDAYVGYPEVNSIAVVVNKVIFAVETPIEGPLYGVVVCDIESVGLLPEFKQCQNYT